MNKLENSLYDIVPNEYIHYQVERISNENFNDLWNELKRIEYKYSAGINYDNDNIENDWESELCYEQGKLIERVEWIGDEIAQATSAEAFMCTYRKLTPEQFKYYLYWRTCFRNGKFNITNNTFCYLMCVYELLAEMGPANASERLLQLEDIFKHFEIKELLANIVWVAQYANVHGLAIQDEIICELASFNLFDGEVCDERLLDIKNKRYDNAYEILAQQSYWKLKNSVFIKKIDCIEDISKVVEDILPKLDDIFEENDLILSDFLIGRIKKEKKRFYPYRRSIWTRSVLEKIGVHQIEIEQMKWVSVNGRTYITDEEGNIERETGNVLGYEDRYLSEYILRYVETLFRKQVGYSFLNYPEKLKGALKMKFVGGWEYVLSTNKRLQIKEKAYISLYDEIEKVIIDVTNMYFENNKERIDYLRKKYSKACD